MPPGTHNRLSNQFSAHILVFPAVVLQTSPYRRVSGLSSGERPPQSGTTFFNGRSCEQHEAVIGATDCCCGLTLVQLGLELLIWAWVAIGNSSATGLNSRRLFPPPTPSFYPQLQQNWDVATGSGPFSLPDLLLIDHMIRGVGVVTALIWDQLIHEDATHPEHLLLCPRTCTLIVHVPVLPSSELFLH